MAAARRIIARWCLASKPHLLKQQPSLHKLSPKYWTSLSRNHGRALHTSVSLQKNYLDPRDDDIDDVELQTITKQSELFELVARAKKVKNSATFKLAVAKFISKEPKYRKGHVEFIYASMQHMKDFEVHRDLSVYKLLMDLFPKEVMKSKSMWQVEMMHYPKQQQACIDLLDFMESNGNY